ncbi:hypothetical protein OLX02_12275 [Novosphingobium sp. KCTC 2891]|uniref:hypothetical protein n=1 Tax=Novosphingobium sp. KCTC 2891 TaxID=2989730 RepID=UPI0022238002|nr:hypothetical protein [Novosphingobium sp. KCTC 2891]MCW1383596.1 hypothetical protein [Novosphingobium sp. KCTC 2891]
MSGIDTIAGKRILILDDDGIDGAGPFTGTHGASIAGIFGEAALSGPVSAGAEACI